MANIMGLLFGEIYPDEVMDDAPRITVEREVLPISDAQRREIELAISLNQTIYDGVWSTEEIGAMPRETRRDSVVQLQSRKQPEPEIRSIGQSARLIRLDDAKE